MLAGVRRVCQHHPSPGCRCQVSRQRCASTTSPLGGCSLAAGPRMRELKCRGTQCAARTSHRRLPRRRQPDRARGRPGAHRAGSGPACGGGGRRLRRGHQRHRRHRAAGPGHRRADAAVVPPRGHRRGQGGAQALPGHRRRGAVAVRRPRVRGLAAGRGLGRVRLPAEGPGRRGQPARRRDPQRGHRRHRARPRDRRGAGPAGHLARRARSRRGGTARHDRRGQADQGDRGRPGGCRPRRWTPRSRPCS